jgi:large-conductance mechanosensitive channel
MFEIIKRALLWLIDIAQVKFIVTAAISAITLALYSLVQNLIQPIINVQAISNAFAALPPSVWYFADMLNMVQGFTMLMAAFVIRFIVRRLPFVG